MGDGGVGSEEGELRSELPPSWRRSCSQIVMDRRIANPTARAYAASGTYGARRVCRWTCRARCRLWTRHQMGLAGVVMGRHATCRRARMLDHVCMRVACAELVSSWSGRDHLRVGNRVTRHPTRHRRRPYHLGTRTLAGRHWHVLGAPPTGRVGPPTVGEWHRGRGPFVRAGHTSTRRAQSALARLGIRRPSRSVHVRAPAPWPTPTRPVLVRRRGRLVGGAMAIAVGPVRLGCYARGAARHAVAAAAQAAATSGPPAAVCTAEVLAA